VKSLADCRLYTFIDTACLRGRDPVELAMDLCEGGADLIQLRAKEWSADQIQRTAEVLLPICEMHGVLFVVNDHPNIAARVGAPMAHLGQEDFFEAGYSHVSELPIPDSLLHGHSTPSLGHPNAALRIGLSTHAPEQAERAVAAGAAYIAVGPVFSTPTKPGRRATTLKYVQWAATNLVYVPWFAIGGISLSNLDDVLAAGARRICVVSAILNAPRVAAACREFRARLSY
jgi:thiamine-phosphate pyrophosphorylase